MANKKEKKKEIGEKFLWDMGFTVKKIIFCPEILLVMCCTKPGDIKK